MTKEFDLSKLPKALSAEERSILSFAPSRRCADVQRKAIALIDDLTEHRAEAVARMTVAERTVAETTDEVLKERVEYWREQTQAMESQLAAANARAEAAERVLEEASRSYIQHVQELTRNLQTAQEAAWPAEFGQSRFERAESEAATLRADNERLRADIEASRFANRELHTIQRQQRDMHLSREESANVLLQEMRQHIPQDRRPGSLFRRSGAHLADHPAVPLDEDALVKVLCDLAWNNGWVLTYKLDKRKDKK